VDKDAFSVDKDAFSVDEWAVAVAPFIKSLMS
jgi:hypothetical protein